MSESKEISIGTRKISATEPTFIIAEAGVNHNGDFEAAKRLVDIAAAANADAIKFQSFKTEEVLLESVKKANYQVDNTGSDGSQFEMVKKLEFGLDQFRELKEYSESKGLVFITTPFDSVTLAELDSLNLSAYKIASTDTTNIPFLRQIAQRHKPMILSTGMCYQSEVDLAVAAIKEFHSQIIVLQCTSNYPMGLDEANLRVLDTYAEKYNLIVGYSDHSEGIGVSPYAVARGASLVEKHFTEDKTLPGPDHKASLDPNELKEFVTTIRNVDLMLGHPEKAPTASEANTRAALQKCLVAYQDIAVGEKFSADNLRAKRTGGAGLSPIRYDELMGKPSAQAYGKNQPISEHELR